MASFLERTKILSDLVGKGTISAEVKVDQIYAGRQHWRTDYAHPGGGEALYLAKALDATSREHLQRVAMAAFTGGIRQQFIQYGERLARESSDRTPVELGNLKGSDSVKVKEQGRIIYSRSARVGRMSRTQLNSRIRSHHIDRIQRGLGGG